MSSWIFFTQFLGVIVSIPYSNVIFDTKFVQNWQGFWFSLITNSIFQFCYTSIISHQVEFSVVHREVSNKIYALSAYYISQIVISVCVDIFFSFITFVIALITTNVYYIQFIWTVLESLIFIYMVFWIVGIKWEQLLVTTFVIHMLVSRSYGNILVIRLVLWYWKLTMVDLYISCVIGSALSAIFEKFDHILLFSVTYDYLGVALSGAYLSLG